MKEKKPKKSKTRFAILGALSIRPMSGYDLKEFFNESVGNFWNESYGQIYPVLKDLEMDGFVSKESETQGERIRNLFSISKRGREELKNWLKIPPEDIPERNELLLKIFFGQSLPVQLTMNHIKACRTKVKDSLAHYEGIEEYLRKNEKNHPSFVFWLITVRFGIHSAQAVVAWADEALKLLKK